MGLKRHLNYLTWILALMTGSWLAAQDLSEQPAPGLVRLDQEMPGIIIKLRYAGKDNFTGKNIYGENAKAWLRPETVGKLKVVQDVLRKQGYQLVIWDAYRPAWAQEKLWQACPNGEFVAPPKQGSRHTRGTTVDVTLADANGRLVAMPTDFDSFTPQASH